MSEIGEYFSALRQASQEKRASNRAYSTAQLTEAGATFTTRNGGAHLVVTAGKSTIDYWPGTGLWMLRGNPKKRRGLAQLLGFIKSTKPPQQGV